MHSHVQQLLSTTLDHQECGISPIALEKEVEDEQLKVVVQEFENLDGKREDRVVRVGDGSIISLFAKTPKPVSPTDVVCPHFLELKWATGCPYSCAWCYLQGTFRFLPYKKQPRPKDYERVEHSLRVLFKENGRVRPEVLNAGELSDSMITERSPEPFSKFVMNLAALQDHHRILFVTKSTDIENLLTIKNKQQAIVSFSLNSEKVAARWEKAPHPYERIEAAGRLNDAGYEVRLRIDPMVPIEDWKEDYLALLEKIFDRLEPERITIGSLRGLQSTINNSVDRSWVTYLDERSNWGRKVRYDLRLEMYRFMFEKLKQDYRFDKVALCKETMEMWRALDRDYGKMECNCML